jgi:hypothetical protein
MDNNTVAVVAIAGACCLEGIALIFNRDGTTFAAVMTFLGVAIGAVFHSQLPAVKEAICRKK